MHANDTKQKNDKVTATESTEAGARTYEKPSVAQKSLGEVVRGGPISGGTDFQSKRFAGGGPL